MANILFNNPEIIRNFRSRLRLKSVLIAGIIIVAICLFIGILALGSAGSDESDIKNTERWHNLFMIYASFALLIGYIYGASSTATSIISEKEKNTYDLLFLTPISDITLSVGKLIGSTALGWLMLLVILPFILISGLAGKVNGINLILFCLILTSGTLFFASLGLLVSISVRKTQEATGGAVGLVVIIIIISSIFIEIKEIRFLSVLSPIPLMVEIGAEIGSYTNRYTNEVSFFGLSLNGAYITILGYLYLTCWTVIAITRKIRNPLGTYLSKLQAVIFFLIFEIFMVGAIWEYSSLSVVIESIFDHAFMEVIYAYTFTNIILLMALALGLTLSYDDYFTYVRANLEKRPYKLFHQRSPSHLLFVIFFIIMLAGFFIAFRSPSLSKPLILNLIVTIEIVALFYLLGQLLKAVMKNYGGIITMLSLIVANSIPPLVISVFGLPYKYYTYLNPIAYIGEFVYHASFPTSKGLSNAEYYTLPILLGILLIIVGIIFINRHYAIKKILVRRLQM